MRTELEAHRKAAIAAFLSANGAEHGRAIGAHKGREGWVGAKGMRSLRAREIVRVKVRDALASAAPRLALVAQSEPTQPRAIGTLTDAAGITWTIYRDSTGIESRKRA